MRSEADRRDQRVKASRLGVFAVLACAALVLTSACSTGPTNPSADASHISYTALGASDAVGVGAFPLTEGYVFEIGRQLELSAIRFCSTTSA